VRKIPDKLRKKIAEDSYYHNCLRKKEGDCLGRITWEHCWIYAGKQINEKWAIIPLCVHHHLGSGMNKELNQWFSIKRATKKDLEKYPKKNWSQIIKYLTKKYGNKLYH